MTRAPVAVALVFAACVSWPASREAGYSGAPDPDQRLADVPVRGFPVTVTEGDRELKGELLAAGPERVIVLGDKGFVQVARRDRVTRVEVKIHDRGDAGTAAIWGGVGTLSTLSHGFGLILTAPIWALTTGVTVAVAASSDPYLDLTDDDLRYLYQYARFPQGVPASVNLAAAGPPCGGEACDSGQVCDGGACLLRCPPAHLACAGQCVDAQTEPLHCGDCNTSCGTIAPCIDGRCALGR